MCGICVKHHLIQAAARLDEVDIFLLQETILLLTATFISKAIPGQSRGCSILVRDVISARMYSFIAPSPTERVWRSLQSQSTYQEDRS